MDLLKTPEDRGYPAEYLLARISGRRSLLIRDWRSLTFDDVPLERIPSLRARGVMAGRSPESVWKYLLMEYRWIYGQMNGTLRELFRPFFLYSELRTLFICLRYKKDGKTERIEDLLAVSLLADRFRTVLRKSEDMSAAISGIETLFLSLAHEFKGLTDSAETEGLRGLERQLTNKFLAHTMGQKLHPAIKEFFMKIIDSRNVLSLSKYMRLGIKAPLSFIPGGSIPETRMRALLEKEDLHGIESLIHEVAGIAVEAIDATKLEHGLYRAITRSLKRTGRDPSGIGAILDYLWRCSVEAMNLSTILYGKDLEREAIMAELIR